KHPGRFTDDDLVNMRVRLNDWLGLRRDSLAEKLDGLPSVMKEAVLQLADRRLDRVDDKMWKKITEAVKRHNAGIPPVDPPGNPLEEAERIYTDWTKSLQEMTDDYL
ncbi:hypothetical protein MXD63_42630, partial [Frankia sp. Cpl3]|nr:hypothetical protein [Frankia sp. Cpl3]